MSIGFVLPAYGLSEPELDLVIGSLEGVVTQIVIVRNDRGPVDHAGDRNDGLVRTISIEGPIGKTEAVLTGLSILLENQTLHYFAQADGHHKQPIGQVARLVERAISDDVDMIVGNRYGDGIASHDTHRTALTSFWSQLVNVTTGYRLPDACCGLRVYSRRLAERFTTELRCFGYGLEVAQLLASHRAGWRILDEPVVSEPQSTMTAAEKLEDNLAVLLDATPSELSGGQRLTLCRAMAEIKLRRSFTVNASVFGLNRLVCFEFAGLDDDGEDAYSLKLHQ